MKTLIFHWSYDSIVGIGGGEVLINNVGRSLSSPVHCIVRNKQNKLGFVDITPKIPFSAKLFRGMRIMDYLSWSSIDPMDFDLDADIILTSGMTTRAIITPDNIPQVNLCFSPPRFLYDMWHHRRKNSKLGCLLPPIGEIMRIWDQSVDSRVDNYITISPIVKRRLWKYLKRDSDIIYPPIDCSKYQNKSSEDYFLFLSRIEPEKRPEEAIQACINTHQKLIIAGTGSLSKKLESKYKNNKNIVFAGFVKEEDKIELLSHCEALIYTPIAEDFGIVPIEALASGKPVICSNDGFPPTLIKDKYGTITDGTSKGISGAIKTLPEFNSQNLINCAKQFDFSIFKEKLNERMKFYYDDFNNKFNT